MACKLGGDTLYRSPPYKDIFAKEDALAYHPRCMEQTCFAVGSCLLAPCDSLRPAPALPPSFDLITRNSKEVTGQQELLCAYLSLEDYKLYYKAFDRGQDDGCWGALASSQEIPRATREMLRVWEQIGFVPPDKTEAVLTDYNKSYTNIIEGSRL